jgi:hypothetical protein
LAKHEDFGKHVGAQGGKNNHPAVSHPSAPAPKSSKAPVPSHKGKGK